MTANAADAPFHTVIEPFRIHSVEPLRMTTADYRRGKVREAAYNLFQVHADDVQAAPRELASNPSGAAARVEHRTDAVGRDEVRLAVDVLARGGPSFIGFVVGVSDTMNSRTFAVASRQFASVTPK